MKKIVINNFRQLCDTSAIYLNTLLILDWDPNLSHKRYLLISQRKTTINCLAFNWPLLHPWLSQSFVAILSLSIIYTHWPCTIFQNCAIISLLQMPPSAFCFVFDHQNMLCCHYYYFESLYFWVRSLFRPFPNRCWQILNIFPNILVQHFYKNYVWYFRTFFKNSFSSWFKYVLLLNN